MSENIVFRRSWLPIEKNQFRILAMLAAEGKFEGNLSDLCRYFSVTPQQKNRNALRQALERLEEQGFIVIKHQGRNYCVSLIPTEEESIEMRRDWFEMIRTDPNAEGVSWENVIKVFLWIQANGSAMFTNAMIAAEVGGVSESTVSEAKGVLENVFSAIRRQNITLITPDGEFRRIGQTADVSAWWENN